MSVSPKVGIVIPAYNESAVIYDVIKNTIAILAAAQIKAEIIVVNDNSTDTTALMATKAGATVIDHIINTGAGGATATGLSYANTHNFDIAVTMDADGQHSPDDVINGIKEISGSSIDLLIGSRLIDSRGMSRVKILGNKGLSFITYVLFGVNSTDSQSGLRVFSKKALQSLRWKTSGYEFCSEMLWRAKQLGLNYGEFPIQAIYTDYSKAKGQNNWNAINIIKFLIKRRIVEILE